MHPQSHRPLLTIILNTKATGIKSKHKIVMTSARKAKDINVLLRGHYSPRLFTMTITVLVCLTDDVLCQKKNSFMMYSCIKYCVHTVLFVFEIAKDLNCRTIINLRLYCSLLSLSPQLCRPEVRMIVLNFQTNLLIIWCYDYVI